MREFLHGPLGRRTVLGAGAAAVLAALPSRRAQALPATPQARPLSHEAASSPHDLAATGTPWMTGARLRHTTVLQSFAFDERRRHLYALQVMQGGIRLPGDPHALSHPQRVRRGDLCLNRLTWSGEPLDCMYLRGFGHGGALGVVASRRGAATLWTEWDASPRSGYGRGICHFRFAPGRILERSSRALTTYRPLPGSTSNYAALDLAHGRVLLRCKVAGSPQFRLYDIGRFKRRDFRPLTVFPQPGAALALPFQGMALHGYHAYQLLGSGYGPGNPAPPGNARLYRIDVRTGHVMDETLDPTALRLVPREPEGLAVLRRNGPRLCVGYTQGPAGARRFCLYTKALP